MNVRYTLNDLPRVAEKLIENSQHKIWRFDAPMGAGKTTLIKALAKKLGMDDMTGSPTFSIVNEYPAKNGRIFHFDLYRLKSEEEAYDIGLEEYFNNEDWCFIEWADKAERLLPDEMHTLSIRIIDEHTRELNFE